MWIEKLSNDKICIWISDEAQYNPILTVGEYYELNPHSIMIFRFVSFDRVENEIYADLVYHRDGRVVVQKSSKIVIPKEFYHTIKPTRADSLLETMLLYTDKFKSNG